MQFWTTEQRGAVVIATFSNPPRNDLVAPAIDELEQLVELWREPSIRAVVIQSRPDEAGFLALYSVEELYGVGQPSDTCACRDHAHPPRLAAGAEWGLPVT